MHKTNIVYRIVIICGMALAMLAGCRHPQQGRVAELSSPRHEETTPIEETSNIISEMRRPDVKIHVKRGQPLAMQTDGLVLTAVDAAVQREADYSVTSLVGEELPPLPQGMMNMTAATAGYRLLPGGEHFLPYAELRMTYDPERLPEGYTPDDIYTSFYDTATLAWVRLERVEVDTVNHEIVSLTTHFTDFINELLKAPEMPETQAFVPTAMNDLEAVSPLDGLALITPPEANNEGTANLYYPIRIPAGRSGMQPNLSVNYSSSSGNGWLGVGWDLSVPSITLDTRWGVPRYNAVYETEIYLLGGEQLITRDDNGAPRPMPHRTNNQTLRSALGDNVRFYARTGDAHDSIIRHNTSTSSYWWEVVDRNGVTHYYGHYPDNALNTDYETTLKDGHGNIAKWMLAESRDTYGNWVRYYYDVVTTEGTVPGKQIYLAKIEYTGNNSDSGKYSVNFIRKKRNSQDIPVSCNLGFKEATDQELCYITVNMGEDEIAGYFFEKENTYKSNFKTRLKSIYMTANGAGELIKWCNGDPVDSNAYTNRQDFQYYDAPSAHALFSDNYESAVGLDDISAFLRNANFRADSVVTTTALGLTQSSNWSVGGTLGVGLGANVSKTTSSIGGNYHWSENSSESLVTLADLDGDGLADKVYKRFNTVYWRKQNVSTDSNLSFGEEKEICGIDHFLVENGKTSTLGVQADVRGIASGSSSWTNTTSTTSTYFADVNGDGVTDLVVDGQVYFNRIVDGEPRFSRYVEPPHEEEEDEPETRQPVCDSIIFDGEVSDSVACDRVWVLDTGLQQPVDSAAAMEVYQNYQPDEDHAVAIARNDSGQYYVCYFHAEIDCSRKNLAARGVPNTESVRVWVAPNSGTADVSCAVIYSQDTNAGRRRHADGVTYVVQHSKGVEPANGYRLHSTQDVIIDTHYFCASCQGNGVLNNTYTIAVDSGDILMFRLQSMDDKQFDMVSDIISIYLNGIPYSSSSSFVLTDRNYFEAPYDGHYSLDVEEPDNAEITLDTIRPSSPGSIAKGDRIQLIASSADTNVNWDFVDTRARIRFWCDSLADTMTVWTPGLKKILHPAGHIWGDTTYQRLFGPLYNGWGQFAYHPRDSRNPLIVLDSLIAARHMLTGNESQAEQDEMENQIRTPLSQDDFDTADIDDFSNSHGSLCAPLSNASCWVEMTADAEHNRWVAFGAQNSIGRDTMSNMMQEEWYNATAASSSDISQPSTSHHDDAVPPTAPDGTPAKAIVKVNSSSNHSYTVSALAFSTAYSHGNSSIETDYIDMNGDHYPDIVGTGYVQYRQQWGGLGSVKGLPFGICNVTTSVTNSAGASFGASPVAHYRTASPKPALAKFTLSGDGSSVNGDFNIGWDHASSSWTDVNGDGLPDYVTNEGLVRLNTGYGFLGEEDWNFTSDHALHSGMSASGTASVGIPITNIAQGSIQLGVGLSRSVNRTDHTLMDINGDGLPDLVWRNVLDLHAIHSWRDVLDPRDSIHVRFNLGNGRWSDTVYDMNINNFNWSEAYNESLNIGATVGFTVVGLKATVGVNGTPCSHGTNRDRMQLVDVNGDGLPDLVTSDREDRITVRYNTGGRTNLLRKVTNYTGSEIHLGYTLSIPDYRQPSRTWLMDRVATHDPHNPNGGDTSVTVFEYSNPNYNRFERTFFGYGTIVTKQIDPAEGSVYRQEERDFCNTNVLNRGRIMRTLISDGEGNKYIEKVYQYDYAAYDGGEPDTCTGNAYSIGDRMVTRYYEGAANPGLTVAETYRYDRYHNVVTYIDEGDTARGDDGLTAVFTYYADQLNNLVGLRESYSVTPTGSTSPQRAAWYGYNPQGRLILQTQGIGSTVSTYEFEYEPTYGNLVKSILPRNKNNQQMEYLYTYDDWVHTYPVRIENSFFDTTATTYDYRFGKPLTVTDPSGSTMAYTYDCLGRLTSVRSPKDTADLSTVRNFYYADGRCHPGSCSHAGGGLLPFCGSGMNHSRPYAVTEHFDDRGRLITRTVVIADGFGRVLQTKKGLTADGEERMQVSGHTVVDAFGRTVRQYDPFTVADTSLGTLGRFETYRDSSATVAAYDVLDRTTSTERPLGVTTRAAYSIGDDQSGHRRFVTAMTDPNGNVTTQYADHEGRKVQVTDASNGVTLMHYDNLGQLAWTRDPEGFTTTYDYDMLGRMTKRVHPDAGETRYTYDPAGNLVKERNPLGEINYDYTYYRLLKKRYSNMTGNDVTYTYGTTGTGRGRITKIEDGAGMQEMAYDALGNVTDETRTIALPQHSEVYRFRMLYEYDSWGRMLTMTYPDNEKITYTYQWGGDLRAMHGNKNGDCRTYIKGTFYNTYGQKEYVDYGNATSVHYTYDALHRLVNLKSRDYNGTLMQNIDYAFDGADNINAVYNVAPALAGLGGTYANMYTYDRLNRLVQSGEIEGNRYWQTMEYSPSGRPMHKMTQASASYPINTDIYYGYCPGRHPHAPKRILDMGRQVMSELLWDEAGNLGQVNKAKGSVYDDTRFLFWTEDNRLHTVADGQFYSYYAYDHAGERAIKLAGKSVVIDVNADLMSTASTLSEITVYPSPYMVLTNKGYTKHYYAGGDRVCARVGGGGLPVPAVVTSLSDRANELFRDCQTQCLGRRLDSDNPACIHGMGWDDEIIRTPIEGSPKLLKPSLTIEISSFVGKMAYYATHNDSEPDVYYYHSDHLGSASWITDASGRAVQHLQYLPYGERFVDQRVSGYNERFTFTGKERDEETGYGYFGARYMDHELTTMWLSVDPMADKYPGISPYAYCAWNPVKLVDPDGEEIYYCERGSIYVYSKNTDGTYGFYNKETGEIYSGDNLRYVDNLICALDKLKEGRYGRNIVDFFERTINDIIINPGEENLFDTDKEMIEWNDSKESQIPTGNNPNKKNYMTKTPTYVSLGHELKHAQDYLRAPESFKKKGMALKEISAMITENLIRMEHNIPQRTYYDRNASIPALVFPLSYSDVFDFGRIYDSFANHNFFK